MAYNTSAGMSKMAGVLSERMQRENAKPLFLDFGEIGAGGSLTTNTFPVPIPSGSYQICRHVSGMNLFADGGSHAGHEYGDGSHGHTIPIPRISDGDRVLVAWVQNVPVIIDVILKGSSA